VQIPTSGIWLKIDIHFTDCWLLWRVCVHGKFEILCKICIHTSSFKLQFWKFVTITLIEWCYAFWHWAWVVGDNFIEIWNCVITGIRITHTGHELSHRCMLQYVNIFCLSLNVNLHRSYAIYYLLVFMSCFAHVVFITYWMLYVSPLAWWLIENLADKFKF